MSGVDYYQVVFTLPGALSDLALANRQELADLLFSSAWKSVSRSIKSEQDYDPAAIAVLHTWNQKLKAHWHVHLLVPGEGPGLKTQGWKRSQPPPESGNTQGYYLVDVDRLRESYRKSAIAKLRRLRTTGKLKFGGKFESLRSDENWEAFVRQLESTPWVAHIQPPPKDSSSPNEVVNYLTRYLTGGPIGNSRIVGATRNEVTFLAREGERVGGERKQVPITLRIEEFVRRWSLHIQPEQLTKTRYLGGWSNQRKAAYMTRCQEMLQAVGRLDRVGDDEHLEEADPGEQKPPMECPHCGSDRMELIEERDKPSWKELFWRESETCPAWYASLQREEHRRFWTGAYGEDFYDWYLETQVEGAKESEREADPPVQQFFPGMTSRIGFEIQSF